MRTPIVLIAGLLVFSHGFAADNLIRLSNPLNFDVPSKDGTMKPAVPDTEKGAAAADNKEVVKNDTPASGSTSASTAAMSAEDKAQNELAARIKVKLAELRAKNGGNPASAKPIPYVSRGGRAKPAKVKELPVGRLAAHASHWSYEGEEGPTHWSKLNPAWAQCASGRRQSPIDIHEGIKVDLEAVKFDYKPEHFKVTDNGHTIQVDVEAGSRIALTGRTYELVQFHFHRPSEERINGNSFQMVVHLVHKSAQGKLAVVALLVEEGVANGLIQTVWNNLPLEKNDPVVPDSLMDVNQLLPQLRDYYTYMGSLTTPPCSEGVLWIVMKQPIKLSMEQIGIFTRLYPMNARPIQSNAGRLIKESR